MLYDLDYTWRIVIGDSANDAWCDGWMYAHLDEFSCPFSVGQWVNAGDLIGCIFDMPWNNPHLHLSRIRYGGSPVAWASGFDDWEFIGNPLDYLDPEIDADYPWFENAWGDQLFAFCTNNTASYFAEGSPISGDVDIICLAYDYYHYYNWKVGPYKLEYKIEGDTSIPWTTSVEFNEEIGNYTTMLNYRAIVYQDDGYCTSEFIDSTQHTYFYNLTNTDGDLIVEGDDLDRCWQTTYFPNGLYKIFARVSDFTGNNTVDSMTVTVENYLELSGTVTLETATGDYSGAIVTIVSSGISDTTDANGEYLISSVGGGSQAVEVSRKGYILADTVLMMNENRSLDVALNFDYICGDANCDGTSNVGDAVYLIAYVFKAGPAPDPLEAGDANCDGQVNVGDAVYLIAYVFKGGPEPCCP